MTYKDQIENEYFEWLYNYACKGKINERISYRKLFMLLHDIDFDFYIREDVNRAVDGIDLRNRFATIKGDPEISDILDDDTPDFIRIVEVLVLQFPSVRADSDGRKKYDISLLFPKEVATSITLLSNSSLVIPLGGFTNIFAFKCSVSFP